MSIYVYEDDYDIGVLARSSKNGAVGQNTLYSFSSGGLNFYGPVSPFRYNITIAQLFI